MQAHPGPRRIGRTPNACNACRQSKIKCSGKHPCQSCQRRSVRCHFTDTGQKVVVSGKYLEDLQRRAERQQLSPPRRRRGPQVGSNECLEQNLPDVALLELQSVRTASPHRIAGCCNLRRPDRSIVEDEHAIQGVDRPTHRRVLASPPSTSEGISKSHHEGGRVLSRDMESENESHLRTDSLVIRSRVIENLKANRRKWIWLSPWSTWSFTVRLMLTLGEKLRPDSLALPRELLEPEVYDVPWPPMLLPEVDISCLPSRSHALYLFTTVKFHFGQTYCLFDEKRFEEEISAFYASAVQETPGDCVWFIKFLLVLTFGTAFHTPQTSAKEPPGAKFFSRALAIMQNPTRLWKESLLGIEILAMTGLYLFCIDDRESAHCYLGNAIRVAQLEGLHTQLPEVDLGSETLRHCQNLWWTLYLMDRHFSSSVGLPMSVRDSDITTAVVPPAIGSQSDSLRSLQVNLSHLLSVILSKVYVPTRTPLALFLEQIRSILQTLAHHAQEIERIIRLKFNSCPGAMPRETHYLTMLYHQCVIVATRPPLLSVLKERLEFLGNPDEENWDNFLAQTATVICAGIKSAVKTLQILSLEYSMLEVFLPYDVEFAFGAALHLTMASAVFPRVVDYQHSRHLAHQVLTTLVSRGNRIARARMNELAYIETLCAELAVQGQRQGHQTLSLSYSESPPLETLDKDILGDTRSPARESILGASISETNDSHQDAGFQTLSNMELLESIGISAEDFLSIIQQMPNPESLPGDMPESMLDLDL